MPDLSGGHASPSSSERRGSGSSLASAFKARELALSLVSQPFLQHLPDLLLLQTFHELWLKVRLAPTHTDGQPSWSEDHRPP